MLVAKAVKCHESPGAHVSSCSVFKVQAKLKRSKSQVSTVLSFADELTRREWPGYLTIPQALNRLGQALHPNEWGTTPGFDKLPYKLNGDRFEWKCLRRNEVRGWILKIAAREPRDVFTEVSYGPSEALFWTVADQLVTLVDRKTVKAKVYNPVSKRGRPERLPGEFILFQQRDAAFFSGFIQHPNRLKQDAATPAPRWGRRLVLIDRGSLERWINRNIVANPKRPKPSQAALQAATKAVIEFARETACTVTRQWLRDVARNAANRVQRNLTYHDFDTAVWRSLPDDVRQRNGSQTSKMLARLEAEKANLGDRLAAVFERSISGSKSPQLGARNPP